MSAGGFTNHPPTFGGLVVFTKCVPQGVTLDGSEIGYKPIFDINSQLGRQFPVTGGSAPAVEMADDNQGAGKRPARFLVGAADPSSECLCTSCLWQDRIIHSQAVPRWI
jgi:hypothetical protein